MQDDDNVPIENLPRVSHFLGDAVQIGRAEERGRVEAEEAAGAAMEETETARVRALISGSSAPTLADEELEDSAYRNEIREDDLGVASDVDVERMEILDHIRLEDLPQKVEMPWHKPAQTLEADGRSWVDEGIVATLRLRCLIPDTAKIWIPSSRQRPVDALSGWFCVYKCFFMEFGVRFPIFPLL